ncbi:MAG: DUF4307 domain-containing protein [Actinobacteria bacterium]|nr:DUF4307 domain-containing protein [Actinomycetota bacterium]
MRATIALVADDLDESAEVNHARSGAPATWPPHIRQRYGVQQQPWRQRLTSGGALVLLVMPVAVWSLWHVSTKPVAATLGTYSISADRITLQVSYQSETNVTGKVTCAVRAQDERRIDVGFAYLRLPATRGAEKVLVYTLRTRKPAVAVEVLGCQTGTDVNRLPAAQFPPGVKPPAQAPPGYAPAAG